MRLTSGAGSGGGSFASVRRNDGSEAWLSAAHAASIVAAIAIDVMNVMNMNARLIVLILPRMRAATGGATAPADQLIMIASRNETAALTVLNRITIFSDQRARRHATAEKEREGDMTIIRHAFRSAVVLAAIAAGSNAALAENRVALVIGESAYRLVTPLPNPANDAKAMSQLLRDAGFDVTSAADLSQREMQEQVGDFAAKIAAKGPDTVALVFYAGHGMQIDGENYLVPVDVDPKRETDIPLQAVRLNDVLNTLNSVPSKMRILLLDACRNNPFPAINKTAGHGLALVDTKSGIPGTFLSYSTSPGAEAEDGNGADSPYTTALLSAAREPGLPIEQAFKRVRVAVNKVTEGRQTPWDSSSLTEDFRFTAATGVEAANAGPKPVTAKRSTEEWRIELQGKPVEAAHEIVVADGTAESYEAFVVLFTEGPFAVEAREWLELHRRMVAWTEAVTINTVASYRSFLVQYPQSDLTVTANRLIERLRYRPTIAPVVAAAATSGDPSNPVAPNNAPQSGPSSPAQPTNVALGPTCPCSAPSLPINKIDTPPTKKRDAGPPRRASTQPPRSRQVVDEDVVVYGRPPMRDYYVPAPPPPVGVGIGIGIGGGRMGGPVGYPNRRWGY
jgi:Caspase domain